MAAYQARLEQAQFPGRVAAIRLLLSQMPADYIVALDAEDDGIFDRLQIVLDHVLVVTGAANSQLIPSGWITELAERIDSVAGALVTLEARDIETYSMTMIRALTDSVEDVTKELMSWPLHGGGSDWREAALQAASTYRRSLAQQITQVTEELGALNLRVEELKAATLQADHSHQDWLSDRQSAVANELAELRAQISQLDRQRLTVDGQLTASIERADQAISAQQQQFSQAQETRSDQFRTTVDDLIEQSIIDLEARKVSADVHVTDIEKELGKAQELLGVFTAAGTANAFSKEAREQAKAANSWRWIAIALGVTAGLSALTVLLGGENPAWELVAVKLAISVAIGGAASYAATQSSRHRRREETARHLELNIASFEPFVRDLDPSKQGEARERVVDSIFLRDISGSTVAGSRTDATLSADQITLIGKVLDQFKR